MYSGELFFKDEDNYITVHEFIERDADAGIRLTTTWGDLGEWSIDTTAQKNGDSYQTRPVSAVTKLGQTMPLKSTVRIEVKKREQTHIEVVGTWSEGGHTYEFEGELQRIV